MKTISGISRNSRLAVMSGLMGLLSLAVAVTGCGGGQPAKPSSTANTGEKATANNGGSTEAQTSDDQTASSTPPKKKFSAVAIGGAESAGGSSSGGASLTPAQQRDTVLATMKPLQVLLGTWRGTTNREFKGFKAVDELQWIWDLRTEKGQPALVFESDKSPYIRSARLTYLPQDELFRLTVKTPEDVTRVLTGKYEREPEDVPGDDNKPQRTYKLLLTEEKGANSEAWQVAFNQLDNNRYLVELSVKKGAGAFQRLDTVGTQREGTSIAANDEDYGDRKCIISGGLGTIQVSYEGKSYWVCCTGCAAAFNEDPKTWLAKLSASEKK